MTTKDAFFNSGHQSLSNAAHRFGHDPADDQEGNCSGASTTNWAGQMRPHVAVTLTAKRPAVKGHIPLQSGNRRRWPSQQALLLWSVALLVVSLILWQSTSQLETQGKAYSFRGNIAASSNPALQQLHRRVDGGLGKSFTFQEYEDEEAKDYWGSPPAPGSRFVHYENEIELYRWAEENAKPPDRTARIVIVLPSCCQDAMSDPASNEACYRHALALCAIDAPDSCYADALASGPCPTSKQISELWLSYFAALRDAVPFLVELGWKYIDVIHSHPREGLLPSAAADADIPSQCEPQQARGMVPLPTNPEIIVADLALIPQLSELHPAARFVAVEASNPATLALPPNTLWNTRVLAVLKAQTLKPAILNNRYSLFGMSHLAFIPGSRSYESYNQERELLLPDEVLARIKPLLSHAHRYRHPLDCGGSLANLRYQGLFLQNHTHYEPPLLKDRRFDLGYIIDEVGAEVDDKVKAVLYNHWHALMKKLMEMRRTNAQVKVGILDLSAIRDGGALVSALQDIKLLVSPYGLSEWTSIDFDAMLNGCVLLKPRTGAFAAFPDVFQEEDVVEVSVDWRDLDKHVESLLKNLAETQRRAWRAARNLVEVSEPHRYADYLDRLLLSVTQEMRELPPHMMEPGQGGKLDRQGLPETKKVDLKEISKGEALRMLGDRTS